MTRKFLALVVAALALVPSVAQAQQAVFPSEVVGTWMNPHGTVKVQTRPCADKLCGWIVWAAPQALADARDSGVQQLVGTELLRDYRSLGEGHYQGEVYVPDMGRTFYSKIEQQNPNSLTISGCILHGLICKSQEWHRD